MEDEPITLMFTSFRDSIGRIGLKVSIDRRIPKLCSYPILSYLIMPTAGNLTPDNTEKLCHIVLDNNWELLKDFIGEVYSLGIRQIVFCDWATTEQISHGKPCMAGVIGRYINERWEELEMLVKMKYEDGREAL